MNVAFEENTQNQKPGPSSQIPGRGKYKKSGALVFENDDPSIKNYRNLPRTPDENYQPKMNNVLSVPQLVTEVLASNERMYQMTKLAAKQLNSAYKRKVKAIGKHHA